jgi:hypothetical protein
MFITDVRSKMRRATKHAFRTLNSIIRFATIQTARGEMRPAPRSDRPMSHVIGAAGASGAPGGEKDEACVKAGIDKVADQLK